MSTKHYSATYCGRTFTRSTNSRTYTHAIIIRESVHADRARCESYARDEWARDLVWHQRNAAGRTFYRSTGKLELPTWKTAESEQAEYEESVAKATDWLALGEEGLVAHRLANFDKRLAAEVAKGLLVDADGTYYACAGWAGRHDLAAKEAARTGGMAVVAVLK